MKLIVVKALKSMLMMLRMAQTFVAISALDTENRNVQIGNFVLQSLKVIFVPTLVYGSVHTVSHHLMRWWK